MSSEAVQTFNVKEDPYLTQKIMSASPEQLIVYVYDAIISACNRKDQERVLRGLTVLINALEFDYQEIALPLYQLYQYCMDQGRKRNYEEVLEIISDLKSAWTEAMQVK